MHGALATHRCRGDSVLSAANAAGWPGQPESSDATNPIRVFRRRPRFLTTPQAVHERPQIITGPGYKSRNSLEYKTQSQHHETVANHKAQPYKEQLLDAYNADRRRVPVSKEHDGSSLRTYWKGMIGSIREPTDAKM